MAGRKPVREPLNLITGDDFKWSYTWKPDGTNAEDFPGDRELYYEFKDGSGDVWEGGSKWSYEISGSVASIRVESDVADAIANRTPYRLVLQDTGTDPTDESVLIIGNVARQEPQ
ncbi:hypothetical protein NONO_c73620 [Nocardia nova SH22a]|uniref:LtfC/p132/Gp6 beta-sandwich domain-containing protein n=1 Tax=Nocardia nova SH22a TaxID=1415166 RepID=W5TT68_9NOCA|nr:hypothetical protein [Nocardia nova]AHH22118.1 hypothetical protein NONO_c73620 [Nocardia nova SH22a]